jgi:hypothetical protein
MANGQWGSKEDVEPRAPRTEQSKLAKPKGGSAIVVGACLIAAVKIAQERSWDKPAHSPKITATVSHAITIAKKIYDSVMGTFPELF